jgi:nucleotide-binding universal stress UspA family protein
MSVDVRRMLVPVDGSDASEKTFRWACRTARESKAELHAVYVIEVPWELPLEAEITDDINRGEGILARIEGIASEERCKNMQARFLRSRHPGPAIVMEAEERDIDLIILGIPYKSRLGSWNMGPTAEYIFHNALCQMLLWRTSAPSLAPIKD